MLRQLTWKSKGQRGAIHPGGMAEIHHHHHHHAHTKVQLPRWWNVLQVAICVYIAASVPYRIGFWFNQTTYSLSTMSRYLVIDYIFDIMLAVDVFLMIRRSRSKKYVNDAMAVTYSAPKTIMCLVSLVPMDLVALAAGGSLQTWSWCRLNKLLRVFQAAELMSSVSIQHRWLSSSAVKRLVSILSLLLFLAHLYGCIWFLLARTSREGPNWVTKDEENAQGTGSIEHYGFDADPCMLYLRSFYFGITTLSTVGYGDIFPTNIPETLFALLAMVTGAALYASVLANMTSLISNLDIASTIFHQKVSDLKDFVEENQMSLHHDVREKIHNYAKFMWERQKSLTPYGITSTLPGPLREQMLRMVIIDFLQGVPPMRKLGNVVRKLICGTFHIRLYAPDEVIYKQGTKAEACYVLAKGIVSQNSDNRITYLKEGCFGFRECINIEPRVSTAVVDEEFAEIYKASYTDIKNIIDMYESETEKFAAGKTGTWRVKRRSYEAIVGVEAMLAQSSRKVVYRDTRWRRNWSVLSFLLLGVMCITIPIRVSLLSSAFTSTSDFLHMNLIEYLIDLFFLADMIFHMTYFVDDVSSNDGKTLWKGHEILNAYLKSKFALDLIAWLPLDLIWLLQGNYYWWCIFRLNRLIRIARFRSYVKAIHEYTQEKYENATTAVSGFCLLMMFMIGSIWVSSAWFILASIQGWPMVDPSSPYQPTNLMVVIRALYWSFMTITSCGYGDVVPHSPYETIFTCCIMFSGVVLYTPIIAYISSLATHVDRSSVQLSIFSDSCRHYIERTNMPSDLAHRAITYIDYTWSKHAMDPVTAKSTLMLLPQAIQRDINFAIYRPLFNSMGSLKEVSDEFKQSLAMELTTRVLTPHEFLCHKDDAAIEIYIVTSGCLNVLDESAKKVVKTVKDGQHCGEIECILGTRHEVSAQANEYTDVLVLSRKSIDQIALVYPEDMKLVMDQAVVLAGAKNTVNISANLKSKKIAHIFQEDGANAMKDNPNVLLPGSPFRRMWSLWSGICLLYLIVTVPFFVAFYPEIETFSDVSSNMILLICIGIEILVDLFFMVDIYLRLNRFACLDTSLGEFITDKTIFRDRYIKSKFVPDLLASLPLDWIALVTFGPHFKFGFRIFRCIRFIHLRRYAKKLKAWFIEEKDMSAGIVRTSIFLGYIIFFCHWVACSWFYVAWNEKDRDTPQWSDDIWDNSKLQNHLRCLYWAIVTLNTIGYGDIHPATQLETIMTVIVIILGASMYAGVIANMANIVAQLDRTSVRHKQRVTKITEFMDQKDVPLKLRERVFQYFDRLWKHQRGLSEDEVLEMLPLSIKREMIHHATGTSLDQLPLLVGVRKRVRELIYERLHREFFLRQDCLMEQGTVCDRLLILTMGIAKSITSSGIKKTETLIPSGKVIGENIFFHRGVCEASVYADELCETTVLYRDDLDQVLALYPEAKAIVEEKAAHMTKLDQSMASNLSSKKLCRMMSTVVKGSGGAAEMIPPEAPKRIAWEILILIIALYQVIVVPFRLAFQFTIVHDLEPGHFYQTIIIDRICDFIIYIHIVLTATKFAYIQEGAVISDPRKIQENYRDNKLQRDLMSVMPWDLIALVLISVNESMYTLAHLLMACRMVFYLRITDFEVYAHHVFEWLSSGNLYLLFTRSLLRVLLVLHLMVCIWYGVGFLEEQSSGSSWLSGDIVLNTIIDPTWKSFYLRSLYWCVMTVTTIGYGDVTPTTPTEILITIGVMFVGATAFAGLIAYITVIFDDVDVKLATHSMYRDCVLHYFKYKQYPGAFQDQVEGYYEFLWNTQKGLSTKKMLDLLPRNLSNEISVHLVLPTLLDCDILKDINAKCLNEISRQMKIELYSKHMEILMAGELSNAIGVVSEGSIFAKNQKDGAVRTLGTGECFGIAALESEPSQWTLTTINNCEIFTFGAIELMNLLERHPDQAKQFRDQVHQAYTEEGTTY